jgi:hypothetical protein
MSIDRYASLKQGLVGCWIPSVSGSGLLLPDLARGNHGVLTNMDASDWVSGQYGRALDFDGVNDYVTTADSPFDFTDKFSVAFWCKLVSGRFLVTKGNMGLNGYGFDFGGFTANHIEFLVVQNSSNYLNRGAANPGGWVHVCGMFDSSVIGAGRNMLFLNGIQQTGTVTSSGTVTSVTTNNANLIIGSSSELSVYLNAQFDDIRAYSRILTYQEIRLLASRPGIGLVPERRRTIQFQQQQFSPAWSRRQQLIGSGVY